MPKLDANNLQLRIAGSADLSLLHKGKSERIDELNIKIICSPSYSKGLLYGIKNKIEQYSHNLPEGNTATLGLL